MVAAPTLTAKSPANCRAGVATAVTLTGTGLGTGVVPTVSAPGATIGTVTGLSGTSIAFNYTPPAGAAGGSQTITVKTNHTVSNKILSSNVATLTIESGHSIQVGDTIVVTGVDATFNGTYVVTAVGASTVSYALVHADVSTAVATGNILDSTGVTIAGPLVTAAGRPDQYAYANALAVPASGSRAIDSASETTMGVLNPRNGQVQSSPTANSQADTEWQRSGAGVSKAYPADQTNPAIALNQRDQESDLIGVGLGDAGASHTEGPFPVTTKALASNVATLVLTTAHPFAVGEVVTVAGVDATFNGSATITAKSSTSISYAKTHADVSSASATGGTVSKAVADRPARLAAPSA